MIASDTYTFIKAMPKMSSRLRLPLTIHGIKINKIR
jgi:hypothetical protein